MMSRGVSNFSLLCCRAQVGAPLQATVALGADEDELDTDSRFDVNQSFAQLSGDDDRYVSTVGQRGAMLHNKMQADPQAVAAQWDASPQPVAAALNEAGLGGTSLWQSVRTVTWPREPNAAPAWFPLVIWGEAGPPPAVLDQAWADQDWRNAFWLYCQGPGRAKGLPLARLQLFGMLRTHAGPPVGMQDADGNWWMSERVLDTEILRFCCGQAGPDPEVDRGLAALLETEIAATSRLYVAMKTQDIRAQRSLDSIDWLGDMALDEAHAHAQQRTQHVLSMIETAIRPDVEVLYQEFRQFITRWWAMNLGDAMPSFGDNFGLAWQAVKADFTGVRDDLFAASLVLRAEGDSDAATWLQGFVELVDAVDEAVRGAWSWRARLTTVATRLPPVQERLMDVKIKLEAAAYAASLVCQRYSAVPDLPSQLIDVLHTTVTDIADFSVAFIGPVLAELPAAIERASRTSTPSAPA